MHHRNQLNAFNLADDLIEPFRPVIDLLVYQIISDEDELTPSIKRQLFIIPYQELPGNYNAMDDAHVIGFHYTIPRTTRELQHSLHV